MMKLDSVLERVVVIHGPDETGIAVACANGIAAATGVPVAIAPKGGSTKWWLFRDRQPLEERIDP